MTDSRPLVPTSSHLVPDEAAPPSSLVPPLKEGRGRGVQKGYPKQHDLVPRPSEVGSSRQDALADLMQRIFKQGEAGRSVPCVNPELSAWWLSEDVETQEAAARACTTCPALRDCRAYVDEWPEAGGVWAARIPATKGRHSRDLLADGGAS